MAILVLSLEQHSDEVLLTPDGGARARRWRNLPARQGSMDHLTLRPGAQPLELLYPAAEDSYFVVDGQGTLLDLLRDRSVTYKKGQYLHVPAGVPHRLQAVGNGPLVLVGGPCPPVPNAFDGRALQVARAEGEPVVLDLAEGVEIPLVRPPTDGSFARFPIWPGMGARLRSLNQVMMRPGQANPPHVHPVSEDLFYCLSGSCLIEDAHTGQRQPFSTNCLVLVEPGTPHAVHSLGPDDFVSVGGPCPPDLAIFRRFKLLP